MQDTIHATAIEYNGHGVLLRGASRSGKSSIALRLLDEADLCRQNCFLVADDRVHVHAQDGTLNAKAPETLYGLIEMRGVGVLSVRARQNCSVNLIVDLVPTETLIQIPDEDTHFATIHGISIRRIFIAERNPDASCLIRTILNHSFSQSESLDGYA